MPGDPLEFGGGGSLGCECWHVGDARCGLTGDTILDTLASTYVRQYALRTRKGVMVVPQMIQLSCGLFTNIASTSEFHCVSDGGMAARLG